MDYSALITALQQRNPERFAQLQQRFPNFDPSNIGANFPNFPRQDRPNFGGPGGFLQNWQANSPTAPRPMFPGGGLLPGMSGGGGFNPPQGIAVGEPNPSMPGPMKPPTMNHMGPGSGLAPMNPTAPKPMIQPAMTGYADSARRAPPKLRVP